MTATTRPAPSVIGAGRGRRKRGRVRHLSTADRVIIALMIGIPIIVELVLVWWPAVASIVLSFGRWNGVGGLSKIEWIGFENYRNIFTIDPNFWPALEHNLIWLVFLAIIATPAGIFLAVLLDRELPGSKILQSIFFLPVMLSLALIGVIWQLMFSPDQGLINGVLGTERRLVRQLLDQHLGGAGGRQLEAHRLHHDLVLGRAEGC